MTYKCVIVDDEELARELIQSHLEEFPDFEVISTCKNAIEARMVLQEHQIDLLFLDIEMPVLKGTDFYKNLIHKPHVIFTTAHRDYAIEGYELDAVDYLLKPITIDRFFKGIEKFINHRVGKTQPSSSSYSPPTSTTAPPFIFISKDRKQVRLHLDTILFIESLKDYIAIHTTTGKYTIKYSITGFLKQLDPRFLRIHRSYIVNTDKIAAFTKQDVEIGQQEIPIGETYKEEVELFFNGAKNP